VFRRVPTGPIREPDESNPRHTLKSILILSFHLRLGLISGLFRSDSPTKILNAFFISPMRPTCLIPFHPSLFDECNNIW
jgi:hypothetical protein